jgi:hypothetical protein
MRALKENRRFSIGLAVIALFIGVVGTIGIISRAASVSVCNASCDYTTITDAIGSGTLNSGDVITVGADYASTTETFPFIVPNGVDLDCQNSGAVIGTDAGNAYVQVQTAGNQTIKNCTFSNAHLENQNVSDVTFDSNTFTNTAGITGNTVTDVTIKNNTDLYFVSFSNTQTGQVDANTFSTITSQSGGLNFSNSTSISITQNTITDVTTSTPSGGQLIGFRNYDYDIYFATNTVRNPYQTLAGGGLSLIEITTGHGIVIRDNFFSLQGNGGGVQALNVNGSGGDLEVDVQHNTIRLDHPCNDCSAFLMSSWNTGKVAVTSTYNLFASSFVSSTANTQGHSAYGAGSASNLDLYVDHEGYSNLKVTSTSDFPSSSNATVLRYQSLRTDDVSTSNDFEPVPYSAFLDVNGTEDIGAASLARGNDFHVSASGTIDYSSVDATTTDAVFESLRNGDTVHLADGAYSGAIIKPLTYAAVALTGNISILGAGAGTIIQPSSTHALSLMNIGNSTFRDITFTGASSATVTTYLSSNVLLHFNGTDYDQTTGISGTPNQTFFIKSDCAGTVLYNSDNTDVTSVMGGGVDNVNAAGIDLFGNKITILFTDAVATNTSTLSSFISGTCSQTATIDVFVSGLFVHNSNGTYSYDASHVTNPGASIKSGLTNPPTLTKSVSPGNAGAYFQNASGNAFIHVTSTGNSTGFSFNGSSGDNSLVESAFTSNATDIYSSSTGSNSAYDAAFSLSKLTMIEGTIKTWFSVRALSQQQTTLDPTSGQSVSLLSANSASSVSFTTDASGYTAFSRFPAFTLTTSDQSNTAGGFNPYTISTSDFGGLAASSTSLKFTAPFQTVTLTLIPGSAGSSGGSHGAGGLPSTQGGIGTLDLLPIPGVTPSTPFEHGGIRVFDDLGLHAGDLVKLADDRNPSTQEDSTVYELGADGKRHAYPSASVFLSRHCDFSNVHIISFNELAHLPLGKNMTYAPGLRLVKFSTPVVYLVQEPNILRAIPNEAAAAELAGKNWASFVSDIDEIFFGDYLVGLPAERTTGLDLSPSVCQLGAEPAMGWPFPGIPKDFYFLDTLGVDVNNTSTVQIMHLQEELKVLDNGLFPEGSISGKFDNATVSAVKRFQRFKSLDQTGKTGPATRKALNDILDAYR